MQECQRLRDEGRTNIVLNLANATFVASSGVGSLLALTDGYFERQDGSGQSLGTEGICDAASGLAGVPGDALLRGIDAAIGQHAGSAMPCDDETGIVIRRG